MSINAPKPTAIVAALPAAVPFTGPETLERRQGKQFRLRLGANESLFGPSPKAIQAMTEAAAKGYLYGDPEGWDLRQAIALHARVKIENVGLGAGIDDLLMLFARAFISPGDTVVTTQGGYPTFDYVVSGCGGAIHRVQYREDRVDLEALATETRRVAAKLVYLANPDNPSGSWHSAKAVSELRRALPDGTLLILDEAYSDFVRDDELPVFPVDDPGIVRLRTFSKGHGMAGLRIGYMLAAEGHVETLNKIRLHFAVNSVAQAGALASLGDADHMRFVVAETDKGRRVLETGAAELSILALPSRTNFVCLDLGSRERAETTLANLSAQGVFIRKPAGSRLDRCIRVTIGTPEAVRTFLEVLRECL